MSLAQETNPKGETMENQRTVDSLVDPGNKTTIKQATSISGTVSGPGDLFLDGKINGDITISGLLFIGENGAVQGEIAAGNMILAGRVEGRVTVAGKIEIRSTAHIQGDLVCQCIAIAENAHLDGEVHTHKGNPLEPEYFTEKRKDLQQPAR
jgi:cytoskeletal protein CcmA (bactofilin family)